MTPLIGSVNWSKPGPEHPFRSFDEGLAAVREGYKPHLHEHGYRILKPGDRRVGQVDSGAVVNRTIGAIEIRDGRQQQTSVTLGSIRDQGLFRSFTIADRMHFKTAPESMTRIRSSTVRCRRPVARHSSTGDGFDSLPPDLQRPTHTSGRGFKAFEVRTQTDAQ